MALLFLISLGVLVGALYAIYKSIFHPEPLGPTPFHTDARRPIEPAVLDQGARDKVLKQGYTSKRVPDNLDAIIIGSGMGGLTAAALLAKAGKKVLVLEQHDQAGGCTHTFHEHGFEFDTGIHYIGEMRNRTMTKFLLEQITEGQVKWHKLEDDYDTVVLTNKGKPRFYPIMSGKKEWMDSLKKQFNTPDDHASIDAFFAELAAARKSMPGLFGLKALPKWLSRLLVKTGLAFVLYGDFLKHCTRSLESVLDSLTKNPELKAVLAYNFGDYGTNPKDAPFFMHANLINHMMYGVAYPENGSTEFPFHMIPVIESAGGKVLVRARVSEILLDPTKTTAVGVRVQKDGNEIRAPLVISDAGVYNTFESLIKDPVPNPLKYVNPGLGAMTLYVGLKGTPEELNLKAKNYWIFSGEDLDTICMDFFKKDRSKAGVEDTPLMFLSFPSGKDPHYQTKCPGKTTCEIVTLCPFEWFEEWKDERVKHRGEAYEKIKNSLGNKMWEQTLRLFPHLKDKVEYFDVGSPLSNCYYLGAPHGEIYGANHDLKRFSPEGLVELRPEMDVKGLYLTGQDALSGGFAGAMFGGMLCASAVLRRNLMEDLVALKKKVGIDNPHASDK